MNSKANLAWGSLYSLKKKIDKEHSERLVLRFITYAKKDKDKW